MTSGLPPHLGTCHISGRYCKPDGSAVVGTVLFTPSPDAIRVTEDGVIVVPNTVSIALDENGAFEIDLPATDDDDAMPVHWTYHVQEDFDGGRSYDMDAPGGASLNIIDLSPVPSSIGVPRWVGPRGLTGATGPTGPPASRLPSVGSYTYNPDGTLATDPDGFSYTYNPDGTVATVSDGTTTRTLTYSDGKPVSVA